MDTTKTMTKEEAFNAISAALNSSEGAMVFTAPKAVHIALETALRVIKAELEKGGKSVGENEPSKGA